MSLSIADLRGKIVLEDAFTNVAAKVESAMHDLGKTFASSSKSIKDFGQGMVGAGAAITPISAGLAAFGGMAIKLAGDFEQTKIGFTTMLGSGEKAAAFLKELEAFAASTPFQFTELTSASQRLLAMGFSAEKIVPMMTAIGDSVAALGGSGEHIQRVTLALGQMQAKGKVSGEEMKQLAELGIPVWQMLADKIGVSIPKAMKMASDGAIKAQQGIDALVSGMSTKFAGMMEKQSKTFLGQISTLKDEFTFALKDIGMALMPFADKALKAMQALVPVVRGLADTFKNLSPPVQNIVVGIGLFGAALGPVLIALGGVVTTVGSLTAGMAALSTAAGYATTSIALQTAAFKLLSVAAAGVAAFALTTWFVENTEAGKALVNVLADVINHLKGVDLLELERGTGVGGFLDNTAFQKQAGERDAAIKAARMQNEQYAEGLKKVREAGKQAADGTKAAGDAAAAAGEDAEKAKEKFNKMVAEWRSANTEGGKLATRMQEIKVILAGLGDPAKRSGADIQSAVNALSKYGEEGRASANKIKETWEKAHGVMLLTTASSNKLAQTFSQSLNPAIEQTEQVTSDGKVTWEQWRAAGDRAREAISELTEETEAFARADLAEEMERAANGARIFAQTLGDVSSFLGIGADVYNDLADAIENTFGENAVSSLMRFNAQLMTTVQAGMQFASAAASGDIAGMASSGMNTLSNLWNMGAQGGVGGTLASIVSPTALMGNLFGGGEGEDVAGMRDRLIEAQGGMRAFGEEAARAGVTLERLFQAQTVDEYTAALQELDDAMNPIGEAQAKLADAVQRYGFSIEELGPKMRAQQMHEQGVQMLEDFSLLTASGIEVATVIERMGPSMKTFLETAISTGTEVPEAMRPMIEQFIAAGVIVDENGNKFANAEAAGISFTESLSASVKHLVDGIQLLVDSLNNVPNIERTLTIRKVTTGDAEGTIPAMAAGGFVTSPTIALIGEAGPEAVVPLDRLSQMGGGGANEETNRLLRAILSEQQAQTREQRQLPRQLTAAQQRAGA